MRRTLGTLIGAGLALAAVGGCEGAAGGPAVAVITGGPGRPLRVELVDLSTGATRAALDFPDRTGGVDRVQEADSATCGWDVTADGGLLVLGERKRAGQPAGPP